MRVIIDEPVFASPRNNLQLLEIFALGWAERHTILTNPLYSDIPGDSDNPVEAVNKWLESLSSAVRNECRRVFADAITANASLPANVVAVHVVDAPQSDWQRAHLTVSDAACLLRTPLRLAPNVPLWPMWLNWIFRGSRVVWP